MKIGIIDYNAGNLRSVARALEYLEADYFISGDPKELSFADRLIFPGVGEASSAMKSLSKRGLDSLLQRSVQKSKPVLGICLGCQIVMDFTEEGDTDCLGLVPGSVIRFPVKEGFKVPHMGWNTLRIHRNMPLFEGIPQDAAFYFVHSYYPSPARPEDSIASSEYSVTFTAAIARGSLYAVQFHPEKSAVHGLRLLSNFLTQEDL